MQLENVRSLAALLLAGCCLIPSWAMADEAIPANPELRWWKGNLHTHSLWSDGNDFPEMICEWYRTHDYNFLALSDHNTFSEGQRWKDVASLARRGGGSDILGKYQARFGGGWVETRGEPGDPEYQVRLKPLEEYRALLENRGRFILIQGEEISDKAAGKPVHMNATNLQQLVLPLGGETVRDAIRNNLRAVEDEAQRSGREVLLHLNHPNFGFAITAEDLAAVVEERFFEVYNGHPGVNQLGDADHPPVERLWDIANTLRLGQLNAPPLYGVATDDSHNYHDTTGSTPGRGWVMVRSRYLTPEHLILAIKAADFYASSGVTLSDIQYDADARKLSLAIEPEEGVVYTTQFIGTPKAYDDASEPRKDKKGETLNVTRKYSDDIGKVLSEVTGLQPSYQLTGDELYVRAIVTSSKPHPNPSYAGQTTQAWSQPVGWTVKQ
ncbi:PHP domain-containing protein [Lignipirellula cremea]|uniref:PHP domain protein n=1 Tax=Lignipirellula cremea TaxID=2528010 RepID=A0A518DU34_9BACT|nr:hypothetical protein [Lignipirellula cremea]QDU95345.1 hypothetical protein Pla8534_31600 [Lignipirellula cremea]